MAKYTYKQFIQAHKGKAMDYDGVAGCQCVDLTKYYLDEVFGLTPGAWGDAYYWYDGFDRIPTLYKNFTKIPNTPEFVPQKGDIVVWGKTLNGNWGHIAICSGEGDRTYFKSWENNWTGQHDPTGKITHNYNHVSGFLRPKNQEPITGEKAENKKDKEVDTAPAQQDSKTKLVIDISQWQTNVNYSQLAKEVDGIIIRVGYRGWGSEGTLCEDEQFKNHLSGVKKNKIPYGFYFFSQATTATEAKEEANYVIKLIKDSSPTYPIYIDTEDSGAGGGQGRADNMTKTQRTNVLVAFCKQIEAKGYKAGVYASESWFGSKFNTDKIENYSWWVAKFGADDGKAHNKPGTKKFDAWQFTSKYQTKAIPNGVDMSYFYNVVEEVKDAIQTKENTTTKIEKVKVKEEKISTKNKESFSVGSTCTTLVDLKVRSGPGTTYSWKLRKELTADGQNHSYNQTKAVFKKDTIITILEIQTLSNGEIWIKGPSGWCMARTTDSEYYMR